MRFDMHSLCVLKPIANGFANRKRNHERSDFGRINKFEKALQSLSLLRTRLAIKY